MSRKRHTPEQIIRKLREAEVELAKGQTTAEVARKIGVTEQTYYRWRKEYGGLRLDQAKRLNLRLGCLRLAADSRTPQHRRTHAQRRRLRAADAMSL